MTHPYYVEHTYLWSDGKPQVRRYDYATLDEAEDRMARLREHPGTTRIVLRRRGPRRNHATTLKVIVT